MKDILQSGKKSVWNRFLSMAVALCMMVCMLPAVASAAGISYVALGDSISSGYGLSDPGDVFTQKLATEKGFTLTPKAASGFTSADLLAQLPSIQSELGGADVITITIGGNDLMNALYDFIAEKYNAKYNDTKTAEEIGNIFATFQSSDPEHQKVLSVAQANLEFFLGSEQANQALEDFAGNLTSILSIIKNYNSEAKIIVANQYHPYEFALKEAENFIQTMFQQFVDVFSTGIVQLNQSISTVCQGYGVTVADVYSKFQSVTQNPCNAEFSFSPNLDFHPNAYGHGLIAEVMGRLLSYEATVTPDGHDFGRAEEGYPDQNPVTFTIANTGTLPLSNISVNLSDNTNFTLNKGGMSASLPEGGSTTFTVVPKTGLSAESYEATVTVSADGMTDITKTVKFQVVLRTFTLTVGNGTGGGSYAAGVSVPITAEVPEGNHFTSWTVTGPDSSIVADVNAASTKVTMPSANVTVTANYEPHTPDADDGDCMTQVCCSVCHEVVTPASSGHSYGNWESVGGGRHSGACTNPGCTVSIEESCSGGTASYFQKAECSKCGAEYGALLTDTTPPTGSITIDGNQWDQLQDSLSFDLFLSSGTVSIAASDDSYSHQGYTAEKAAAVGYYLDDSGVLLSQTDLEFVTFTSYTNPFELDTNGKYVLYAKITDHAGNVTYLSSQGFILDKTVPVVNGIENGKTYCISAEFTVTDTNLQFVTVDGTPIAPVEGKYTIDSAGTKEIVVTDMLGNETRLTITVNADHTFTDYIPNGDATCTENGSETAKCEYCDATNIRTIPDSALEHDWGEPVWNWSQDGTACHRCLLLSERQPPLSGGSRRCDPL